MPLASTVSSLFTPRLFSSPSLFSPFSVVGKISLLALFLGFWCPFLTSLSLFPSPLFSLLFQLLRLYLSIPTSPICPTCRRPPLHTQHPSPPIPPLTRMAIKAEGNSLDLKISMSLSLCSCRVASPKAALRYGWPCLFASSGVRAHTTERTHFPKDTQKQLSRLFSSFVIAVIPPQANLALVLSCGFTAMRMELRTQQQ